MQTTRLSVLEEANFHESEISTSSSGLLPPLARYAPLIRDWMVIYSLVVAGRRTSSMAVQNVGRSFRHRQWRIMVALLTAIAGSDLSDDICRRLGMSSVSVERCRRVLSASSLVLFLSGMTRELRPSLAVMGSRPVSDDPTIQRINSGEFISRFFLLDSMSSVAILLGPLCDIGGCIRRMVRTHLRLAPSAHETCASCGTSSIVLPHVATPCKHQYCYYCIGSEVLPFTCYECKQKVDSYDKSPIVHLS